MTGRNLSRRLDRLEERLIPAIEEPLLIVVQYVSTDGDVAYGWNHRSLEWLDRKHSRDHPRGHTEDRRRQPGTDYISFSRDRQWVASDTRPPLLIPSARKPSSFRRLSCMAETSAQAIGSIDTKCPSCGR